MSKKVFCDFCGEEIDAARSGKTWYTITWHGSVTEMQRDICNECFDERLVAIKDEKPTPIVIKCDHKMSPAELDALAKTAIHAPIVLLPNDKPSCEVRADFIYDKLAEWFDAPCNWSFDGMGDMDDFMYEHCGNWCERTCCKDDWAACWRKLFEVMANEDNARAET